MVEIENTARMFHIGVDGWKILRCINTDGEITVAKACELVRGMLAGRSYRLPYWDVSGEVRIPDFCSTRG